MDNRTLVYGGYSGVSVANRNELREVWAENEAQAQKYLGRFANFSGIKKWGIRELTITPEADCKVRINEGSEISLIANTPLTFDKGAIWSVIFITAVNYSVKYGY